MTKTTDHHIIIVPIVLKWDSISTKHHSKYLNAINISSRTSEFKQMTTRRETLRIFTKTNYYTNNLMEIQRIDESQINEKIRDVRIEEFLNKAKEAAKSVLNGKED